ncbi:DUF4345 domain-containing protein [Shinella sp.]|uniref:AGROH133_08824 family phage infection protein n=1 Tax=Shinella sp. TaxID=1870904 RepID=UPI0029B8D117|nr:DUF4345 domain-containing protein [Shinella sp.]MDX3975077.1 DUF4345 domain-containing protein [Shinella sp.]
MEFYIPTETGELLAFSAAIVTALFGLFALFAPGTALKLAGLQTREGSREGYAFARSAGGFYAGLTVMALMTAQNLTYMAIGCGFALAAFGRILSLMSDGSFTLKNLVVLLVQAGLAALPLAYAFGFI